MGTGLAPGGRGFGQSRAKCPLTDPFKSPLDVACPMHMKKKGTKGPDKRGQKSLMNRDLVIFDLYISRMAWALAWKVRLY